MVVEWKWMVQPAPSVMASGVTGSVSVALHPLVILNISDHWIRIRSQEGRPMQVIGALIGKQEGRNIEVMNSFELLSHTVDERNTHRQGVLLHQGRTIQAGLQKIWSFWAGTRQAALPTNRISTFTSSTQTSQSVCTSQSIDIINGEATMLFAELTYTLATEEAERIGVDHVARMTATGTGENSTVAEHLIAQHSAIKMLHSRVKVILEYVKAVEAGEVPFNHEILREANALCHRLPVLSTLKFKTDFYDQCNDVGLMAYLGTITKTCNSMNQFINKFNVLYDRQGIGRRMRGLFF
ncbi:hypothetical protein SKAU_G00367810 [Synaphobranchus kaupii]|uniref:COP9 signalosome complex subunit 6 n=1 Tax=Synaphobranchus kaupii TaxID=118154 RepID=A0A9Q1IEP6_SYNKA|nr:hypothetical protein SKAU_G00367810 [Synaphobranchus kaupii]